MRLKGKLALVTGASSGIGLATARAMAFEGADVALVGRNIGRLNEAAEMVRGHGRRAFVLAADLADVTAARWVVSNAAEAMGGLDILVNDAGVLTTGPALEVTPEEWDHVMAVNVRAVFFSCQEAAKVMRGRGGRIVNVASHFGLVGRAERAPYSVSKGAVVQMTRSLAIEWAPFGVAVNAVAPGPTDTPLTTHTLGDPAIRATFLDRLPLHRIGRPEDIASGIVFLASEEAGYITGQILVIDGGYTAQ